MTTLFATKAKPYGVMPAEALPLGAGLGQQLVPVIRRMTTLQHFAEHPAGIVNALIGALGVLVVDPSEHDHLARCVVAEEELVLLKELGPEPVLVVAAEGVALPAFRPWRVFRDDVERQLCYRSQSLASVLLYVPDWVLLLEGLDLPGKSIKLSQE
ncbi:hypothetical protein PCE31106_04645 [Pandoraea cepalis]|uniref:Uncharacterized protein n=1 Tax=Pandoraea cepalis TaxID=2508294 RepID=A0A5E4YR33_9BURK|nr:hypothetical protein PCE31106_04645 [Pandoraea cepalis]